MIRKVLVYWAWWNFDGFKYRLMKISSQVFILVSPFHGPRAWGDFYSQMKMLMLYEISFESYNNSVSDKWLTLSF